MSGGGSGEATISHLGDVGFLQRHGLNVSGGQVPPRLFVEVAVPKFKHELSL